MSKKKRFGVSQALSRGLSETIHVVENNTGVYRNAVLPLTRIELDPDNPRKLAVTLADVQGGLEKNDPLYQQKSTELERLQELAATIQSSGVINPIIVYKRGEVYRVVAGERRCLASILAGKQEIVARVFNERPQGFELKLVQWIENTAREDLTLDERLGNIRDLTQTYQALNGDAPLTASLLKKITGLSLPQATYYMTVLQGPSDVLQLIRSNQIRSLDKAAVIAGIEGAELRRLAIASCLEGASLKALRKLIATTAAPKSASPTTVKTSRKRGRSMTRINMGFTAEPQVIQTIIECVLNQPAFKQHAAQFNRVKWQQLDEASLAFKKLIKILEQDVALVR